MAELTPCGRILLTPDELLAHKTAAYRDGAADALGNAAGALDVLCEHDLAEQLREAIPATLASIAQTAAQLGVELTPWQA